MKKSLRIDIGIDIGIYSSIQQSSFHKNEEMITLIVLSEEPL